jgi:hypothetical protein
MAPWAGRRRLWIAGALFVCACGAGAALDALFGSGNDLKPRNSKMIAAFPPPVCTHWTIAGDDAGAGALTRFAVIGDYGSDGPIERAVAELVTRWRPSFILTTGDNNYPRGEASTIDANIGLHYHEYIGGYRGQMGCGADRGRFFPALGNHDWLTAGAQPYLDYFTLPGNERYYDVQWGEVHVFALDSDSSEPDGILADSVQARWLKARLAASTARWQVVYMHHPPYSSGPHGSSFQMRWPFKEWGADLVLAGHDHTYERLNIDGLTYIVDGLGGASFYAMGQPIEGSLVRHTGTAGALLIEADASTLRARFQDAAGQTIDDLTLPAP